MRCAAGLAIMLSLVLGAAASLPSRAEAQPRVDPPAAGDDHPATGAAGGHGKKKKKTKGASSSGDSAKKKTAKGAKRAAQSIGAPNSGRLVDGMRLKSTPHLVSREGAHTWGLPALVHLLRSASEQVARKHRGAVVFVGDLSAREGGPLVSHNSHQSGRDADVGYFVTNSRGKPVNVKRFVAFDNDGRARDGSWARFDDARNWALIEAMLKDPAGVRYLFVSMGLRTRLLAYAKKKGKSDDIIQRAATAMMSPKDADLHDDHVHVRIGCPESMRGTCVEESGQRTPTAHEKAGGDDAVAKGKEPTEESGSATPASSASTSATKQVPADTAHGAETAHGADTAQGADPAHGADVAHAAEAPAPF